MSAALGPLREAARDGAEDVLGLYPELGERDVQRSVDNCLEQVADTLRAIDAAATELSARLRLVAQSADGAERRARARLGEGADRADHADRDAPADDADRGSTRRRRS